MKLTVEGLEKERDFYFGKLRDIELICQEHENDNNPTISQIMNTLYATEVNTVTLHTRSTFIQREYFVGLCGYIITDIFNQDETQRKS